MLVMRGLCYAQPLVDPQIPDGESLSFRQTIDKKVSTVTMSTALRAWQGRDVYEVTVRGPHHDYFYRIGRPGMEQLFSIAKDKRPDSIIERQTTIIKNRIPTAENEIALLDFVSLDFLLRGFPLGQSRSLKLIMSGQGPSGFAININRLSDETLTLGDQKIPCYRLELAMTGIMAPFFPKSSFWYSLAPPHYLVRYEGLSGGPGSPRRLLELTSLPE